MYSEKCLSFGKASKYSMQSKHEILNSTPFAPGSPF